MGVIAENMEKYISFNIDVVVDKYVDEFGKVKEKNIQLRFIDIMRSMASSLDSLTNNLVGVSGMPCNECGESCEIIHIDENYVAHGKCKDFYSGYSKCQLNKNFIFDNFLNPIPHGVFWITHTWGGVPPCNTAILKDMDLKFGMLK